MTPAQCVLALWMLVTGSINTLSTKFADMQCVPDFTRAAPPATCAAPPSPPNATGLSLCSRVQPSPAVSLRCSPLRQSDDCHAQVPARSWARVGAPLAASNSTTRSCRLWACSSAR